MERQEVELGMIDKSVQRLGQRKVAPADGGTSDSTRETTSTARGEAALEGGAARRGRKPERARSLHEVRLQEVVQLGHDGPLPK